MVEKSVDLLGLLRKRAADADLDFLREAVTVLAEAQMEDEVSAQIGAGYGEPTDSMNEAVLMLARYEGLLFDPVYSGKALAGMIDYIRQGRFAVNQKIIFLHTGGSAALFAYADSLRL